MTQYPDIFAALATPFTPHEVKERVGSNGRRYKYITARTVMNRLDDVVGPEAWQDEYIVVNADSAICKLSIRLPDGRTLSKSDVGGSAGMSDSGDDDKSMFSDALKRAAVKFGVGRYLYGDGVAKLSAGLVSTVVAPPGAYRKDVPSEARHLPEPEDAPADDNVATAPRTITGYPPLPGWDKPLGPGDDPYPLSEPPSEPPPRHGRGLFAWCADQQDAHQVKFLHKVTESFREEGMPSRLMDWTEEQVRERWSRILRIRDEAIAAKGGNGRHLPEPEGAPPPGGSSPAPAPDARVTLDPLKAARQSLYKRVHRIACVQQDTHSPSVDNLRLVLSGLQVLVPGLPRLDSISACEDLGVLVGYATAAQEQLRRLEPGLEEAPY